MTSYLIHSVQILLFICLYTFHLKADTFLGQNPCISKTNCRQCIQTPSCAWCYESYIIYGNNPRCFQLAGHEQLHKRCANNYYFPSNNFSVITQKPLTMREPKSRKTRDTTWTSSSSSTTYTSSSSTGGVFNNSTSSSGGSYGNSGNYFGPAVFNNSTSSGGSSYGNSGNYFGPGGLGHVVTEEFSSHGFGTGGADGGYTVHSYGSGGTGSGGIVTEEFGTSGGFNGGGYVTGGGHSSGSGYVTGGGATYVNQTVHTSYTETTTENIQITPQRIKLTLRVRESYSFNISYAQAHDYPVDLYYLMDLSKSMEDDKDKLSSLGKSLANTMRNITSEFQLGFGSFVDKVVMPYVSTVPSNKIHPCENCSAPYGYFHAMQLSKNTDDFADMVKAANVSGNLDAPEGGFDALMQAIVCKNQIGWRENARRLLVFSTDDGFHYAGDGKLGGIIKPNDGQCHLKGGYYTYSTIQDYPSISQLNLKVKENSINVIFAVTEERSGIYTKLQKYIEGASSGVLTSDSSNIVNFIKTQYEAISSTVELKDNATNGVEIRYYSKCGNASAEIENKTNTCTGFKVGQIIEFRLEVFLKECPKDPSKWHQLIQVYPVGLSDSVIIDLDMLCSCPCEHPGDPGYEENSKLCSYFGTYKCGICECDPFHRGRTCECPLDSFINQNITQGCKQPDIKDAIECSGKGVCICNKCECEIPDNPNERINGTWCECDNFSCYRHATLICGGHGICDCGVCKCDEPWTGNACQCHNVNQTCYPPYKSSPQLCDGHGECICGVCKCQNTEDDFYTGRYCDRCPNCTEKTCDELKPCVLCQMYNDGPYNNETCIEKCSNFTPVETVDLYPKENLDEYACTGYDEEDCRFEFLYSKYNETHYYVKAQKEKECPTKVFLLGIVLGVIAAVVMMGLAILLLWKLVTTVHDRREFARFEKERMMAKWDTGENPIYKQATSTFKNPTYVGKGTYVQ